ncbi:LruC domain-containing protein [Persicobacter psychrovividus]|uniref:DUF4842 domain-containing protein n=1 Tax=Persicobacter psychrovividus TaxID=387638 RepID=A0ABM7VL84_9BACT|nr:hypothetical protein PEPS_40080 [Persicobacter psychrovividus]
MKPTQFLLIFTLLMASCFPKRDDVSPSDGGFESITVPEGFAYETTTQISLNVNDEQANNGAFYEIAFVDVDGQEIEIGRGFIREGENSFSYPLTFPAHVKELVVNKVVNGQQVKQKVDLTPTTNISFTADNQRMLDCTPTIYGVNGDGELFTIDPDNNYDWGTVEQQMPDGGSFACAVDKYNKRVYINFEERLRYYDLDTKEWVTIAEGNPFNRQYPRMEYNHVTKELWIADNQTMYTLDPADGSIKKKFTIEGLAEPFGGGDIAISLEGEVFMCCFSGLYKFTDIDDVNGIIKTERISAENLPFKPTSLAIDQKDRLFMGTTDNPSLFVEMDKATGAYDLRGNMPGKINDLSAFPCTLEECENVDSDGDGVLDCADEFPEDPTISSVIYGPSKLGWGSIAYEDLWPSKGDYDFNDLVVNYRFKLYVNADGEATKMEIKLKQKARSASYDNGFGIMLPEKMVSNHVLKITGTNLNTGAINLNENGTEVNPDNRLVIIAYDQSTQMSEYGHCLPEDEYNIMNVEVFFARPMSVQDFGLTNFPYNPFILKNGDRKHEIHLFNQEPTALHDMDIFGSMEDASDPDSGAYYQTAKKHPWAIHIIHDYRVVEEGVDITKAYNYFKTWAESGGVSYPDWYKDNTGYRNEEVICTDN